MELFENHFDALKEVLNIGVGKAANILNSMLNSHILLNIPEVEIMQNNKMKYLAGTDKMAIVDLPFQGKLNGVSKLVFPYESSRKLVHILTEFDDKSYDSDFDAVSSGTLSEIGNIILNSIMGMFSNIFDLSLHYTLTSFHEETFDEIFKYLDGKDNKIIVAHISFTIETLDIKGEIILIFETGSFDNLITMINEIFDNE
jgi:chemotaxis protein CheC